MTLTPPIIWSIAGNDSGGGAGLSADQRAALAAGAHLCPVVAAITAQNSKALTRLVPVDPALLDAQLQALASDLPPAAIKTGLIGSVSGVEVVAAWIDRLRKRDPKLPLVVDPVLRASSGAALADTALLQAYVQLLLPRTTVLTPNRSEARRLVQAAGLVAVDDDVAHWSVPRLAAALRTCGAGAVCITGGDLEPRWPPPAHGSLHQRLALDWVDAPAPAGLTEPIQGWLALPRLATPHHHGSGCTHATSLAVALARGFPVADAAVLAKMATTAAVRAGYPAGTGAGPVGLPEQAYSDPTLLPSFTWGDDPAGMLALAPDKPPAPAAMPPGLYALFESGSRLAAGLAALRAAAASGIDGAGTKAGDRADDKAPLAAAQLRIKRDLHPALDDAAFAQHVRAQLDQALPLTRAAGVCLYLNDHWRVAQEWLQKAASASGKPGSASLALPAGLGVHLGQEDLQALGSEGRAELRAVRRRHGLALGVSSHSLWELCRAAALRPDYIACGPVWPTTTKDMPWLPQGLHNLAWWARMSLAPVVAIGGILDASQVADCRRAGARAACLVRALQPPTPQSALPYVQAWRDAAPALPAQWIESPRPSLATAAA